MAGLTHNARLEISLGGDHSPDERIGFITVQVSNASAAELLQWLEVPLAILRNQAKHDQLEDEPR